MAGERRVIPYLSVPWLAAPTERQIKSHSGSCSGSLQHSLTPERTASKMSQLLSGFPGDLASTPEGKGWVTKALHPADPITDCRGIPDQEACPSVMVNYNLVFRATPPPGATSWNFDLTVVPDLVAPGFIRVTNETGLMTGQYNFLNQTLTPPGVAAPSYTDLMTTFRGLGIEAHRLAFMGVTAYQDGPALSDQGTLVAAQWHVARKKYYLAPQALAMMPTVEGYRRVVTYQDNDFAYYARSQNLPNAYFGASKGGCYLPLRLSGNECWRTDADLEMIVAEGGTPSGEKAIVLPLALPVGGLPPYPDAKRAWYNPATVALYGDNIYKPLNSVFGGISAVNLSPNTSFAFYVRMGIECRVSPTSTLASQVRMSPTYDPVALAAYARISRELKDAYPSDFNDLGKILNVIKSIARVVLPGISMMGPVGAAVGAGGSALLGLMDSFGPKSSGRGEANPPPAATKERIQEAQRTIAKAPAKVKKAARKGTSRR